MTPPDVHKSKPNRIYPIASAIAKSWLGGESAPRQQSNAISPLTLPTSNACFPKSAIQCYFPNFYQSYFITNNAPVMSFSNNNNNTKRVLTGLQNNICPGDRYGGVMGLVVLSVRMSESRYCLRTTDPKSHSVFQACARSFRSFFKTLARKSCE